VEKNGSLFRAR